jgi:hypothetical protein
MPSTSARNIKNGSWRIKKMENKRSQVIISNKDDRRELVAILASNGYAARITKATVGKAQKTVVEYWKEDE